MLETSPEIMSIFTSLKGILTTIERDYGVHSLPTHLAYLSISYLRQPRQIRKWAAPLLVARVNIAKNNSSQHGS